MAPRRSSFHRPLAAFTGELHPPPALLDSTPQNSLFSIAPHAATPQTASAATGRFHSRSLSGQSCRGRPPPQRLRRTDAPRLRSQIRSRQVLARHGFFAGPAAERSAALREALADPAARAIFCARGGYGSNYLLDDLSVPPTPPKIFLGASDVTSLQIFLWQKFRCVTFYGPMVATNFDRGPGAPHGYDPDSLTRALTETRRAGRSTSKPNRCFRHSGGRSSRRLSHACRDRARHSLGTRHPRRNPRSRGPPHEALPGGPRSDASEAGRNIARPRRNHSRRVSAVRRAAWRRNGERCRAPHSAAAWRSRRLGRVRRPHVAPHVDAAARRSARLSAEGSPRLEILEPACAT